MKLFYSPNSPYARIARITLRECALENHAEEVEAANRSADNPLLDYCPVGRVPTLVDGDLVVTDTRSVCRYLAERSPNTEIFGTDETDWSFRSTEGQIAGFLEGIAAWVRERRRAETERSDFLLGVEMDRAQRCLEALNINRHISRTIDVPLYPGSMLAAALSLMDLHNLVPDWKTKSPDLAFWFTQQTARRSLQDTAPKLD